MKCIIVEDEPIALDIIKEYVLKIPFLKLEASFRNPFKALTYLQENTVDLLILDINMPDLNGIQFLKSLLSPPLVIFTTAFSEYALESYEYDAVDYLLKPVEFARFLKAANKAMERRKSVNHKTAPNEISTNLITKEGKDYILIKSGTEVRRVMLADILYVEGGGNYATFFTNKGKVISLMTMKDISEMLAEPGFIRVHKSFIISFTKVDKFESHQITIGSKKIPIGNLYRDKLVIFLNK